VHEYEHRAGQGVTVFLGTGHSEYHYVMNSGPFKDVAPRTVAAEAIAWLGRYLDEIDKAGPTASSASTPD
jgi:hypothetical protein